MGFVVLHMEKAHGSDSGTTAHIERFIIPKNADPTRTHLNRRLIEYPDGVKDRSAAVQRRLEEAGLTRKIGSNQVRAIRINVSATPEDMERIEREGRLDEWCADNLKYFADTFGKENIVAAHLHLDEKTPHMHVTLVPIIKGERKRKKREEQAKKRYRKKPTDTVRLCADDIMSRLKLKAYQDSYAVAMKKYGLQRGVDGSEARHVSTQQYYRDIKRQTEELKTEVMELQERKETAREELERAKKEIQTERLKGAATSAATNIAESIGAMFGSNRVKALERDNIALHREAASYEETIEVLQTRIQVMQSDHSRELMTMQARHAVEVVNLTKQHEKEMSLMKTALSKAVKWFPYFREMIRMENVCRTAGFDDEQTATLLKGKLLEYSGELDSEGHNCKFTVERVAVRITPDPTDKRKLQLNIDKVPFKEWCREKFEKMRNAFCQSVQRQQKYKGPRF